MDDVLDDLMFKYEKMFGDVPPMNQMSGYTEKEVVDMLSKCIGHKKDMFELGYAEKEERGVKY